MSHVAPCYKSETKEFGPQLKSLLELHGPVLVSKDAARCPPMVFVVDHVTSAIVSVFGLRREGVCSAWLLFGFAVS